MGQKHNCLGSFGENEEVFDENSIDNLMLTIFGKVVAKNRAFATTIFPFRRGDVPYVPPGGSYEYAKLLWCAAHKLAANVWLLGC